MDRFQVIQPSVLLAPYIQEYWFLTMENVVGLSQRLVPLGGVALTFHRKDRSYLYGITPGYTDLFLSGRIDFITIVFQPLGASAFFKMPLSELNGSCISPDTLNEPDFYELERRLFDTTDNLSCVKYMEGFLLHRLSCLEKQEDKRLNKVLKSIYTGEADVERLAGIACLGYKQFKRVFTQTVGINPKEYLRIVRFRKLHRLLQLHTAMTTDQLAYECGYYDKSHLIKSVKEFSGFTPGQLHEACDAVYSPYHALFRSAFVDLSSE